MSVSMRMVVKLVVPICNRDAVLSQLSTLEEFHDGFHLDSSAVLSSCDAMEGQQCTTTGRDSATVAACTSTFSSLKRRFTFLELG
jgi:hypothetical protein